MKDLEGAAFYISKSIGKAIGDYDMLSDGDKVAVAVSGGKDSLALLDILRRRQSFVPIKYDLLAVHVDLGYPRSSAGRMERYFKKLKVRYHIEKCDALKGIKRKEINCFWCSWNRRKTLFEVADRLGYRKVALGHHKDDIVETILLNLFFHGEISAMSPKQELFKGRIVLIRPLAYAEETLIRRFVREQRFPEIDCSCPNSDTSRRRTVARLISQVKRICPEVKTNIFRSIRRIKEEYLL
ncbi:MAG: ATP-binding protein [Candidatus Omnitrophota bacterium]|jgi:tRNA 2-thiocytidine biosynthesis protein TtcA